MFKETVIGTRVCGNTLDNLIVFEHHSGSIYIDWVWCEDQNHAPSEYALWLTKEQAIQLRDYLCNKFS